IWRALLSLRPLARPLIGCSLGNGLTASYWCDNWCVHGPLITFIGDSGPSKMGINISAKVAEGCRQTGWILPSPRCRTPAIACLRESLLLMHPPSESAMEDEFSWGPAGSRSPSFSIKKTWEQLRPKAPEINWQQAVWFKSAVPKHAFLLWICHLDRLPVRARLARWNATIDPSCCLCGQHVETRDHLLLQCTFSSQLWSMLLQRLGQPSRTILDWNSLIRWCLDPPQSSSRTLTRLSAQALISIIWSERNNRLHKEPPIQVSPLFRKFDRLLRDILLARLPLRRCNGLLSLWFTFE
ncbi:unnamed protein product, partial [Brassica rapa subsp. narinosa]